MFPIALSQVQQIQATIGGRGPFEKKGLRPSLRPVRAGTSYKTPSTLAFGPTTERVGTDLSGYCGSNFLVVVPSPAECKPPIPDAEGASTIARGVAEGLRRAPLIPTDAAPWLKPGFRGERYPQTALVALNTFGNTDVRTIQAQRQMAGYLGTAAVPVTAVNAATGVPAQVISFQVPDSYHADEFVVDCQDDEILYTALWRVTVQGKIVTGTFRVFEGRAPLNLQAKRDETVAVEVILQGDDAFAVPLKVLVNGWTYPSTQSTDGTYDRVLRASPNWRREEIGR